MKLMAFLALLLPSFHIIRCFTCYGFNSTDSERVCSGHGVCSSTDYCQCFEGWLGYRGNWISYDCSVPDNFTCDGRNGTSVDACSGQGYCVAEDTCECVAGWYGLFCQHQIVGGGPTSPSLSELERILYFIVFPSLAGIILVACCIIAFVVACMVRSRTHYSDLEQEELKEEILDLQDEALSLEMGGEEGSDDRDDVGLM